MRSRLFKELSAKCQEAFFNHFQTWGLTHWYLMHPHLETKSLMSCFNSLDTPFGISYGPFKQFCYPLRNILWAVWMVLLPVWNFFWAVWMVWLPVRNLLWAIRMVLLPFGMFYKLFKQLNYLFRIFSWAIWKAELPVRNTNHLFERLLKPISYGLVTCLYPVW